MRTYDKTRRAIEHDLAKSMAAGYDTDERLQLAQGAIEQAEATFRRLAEPRVRE
jgi:hypothetical protein